MCTKENCELCLSDYGPRPIAPRTCRCNRADSTDSPRPTAEKLVMSSRAVAHRRRVPVQKRPERDPMAGPPALRVAQIWSRVYQLGERVLSASFRLRPLVAKFKRASITRCFAAFLGPFRLRPNPATDILHPRAVQMPSGSAEISVALLMSQFKKDRFVVTQRTYPGRRSLVL